MSSKKVARKESAREVEKKISQERLSTANKNKRLPDKVKENNCANKNSVLVELQPTMELFVFGSPKTKATMFRKRGPREFLRKSRLGYSKE